MQHIVYDLILLFDIRNDTVFVLTRQKRQILQLPFFIFFVIFLRIDHLHQMTHTPGNDKLMIFNIAVISSGYTEHTRKILCHGRFLGYDQFFTHNSPLVLPKIQ